MQSLCVTKANGFDMLKNKINYFGNTQLLYLFGPLDVMEGSDLKI